MKLLKDALVLHIENKRAQLLTQGVDEEKLQEKISVLIMADLQEKQKIENNAVANILGADKVSQRSSQDRSLLRTANRGFEFAVCGIPPSCIKNHEHVFSSRHIGFLGCEAVFQTS